MNQPSSDRLRVVMKPVAQLIPYEHNPRQNDHTAEQLKSSIEQFGFRNPIIIDEHDTIIAGHARLKAAMALGMDEVPCIYAKNLTEDEIRAYRLADNRTAEIAGWNYDKLCEEMQALQADSFNLDWTGFNIAEQFFYLGDSMTPDKTPKTDMKRYEQDAEKTVLKAFNVAIICEDEDDKEWLRQLIGERKKLRRVYPAEEILANLTAAGGD